jgi:micrococcal nuclease
MKKSLLLLFFTFYFITNSQTYKVIGVKDGDTVSILMEGKEQTVRLAHIDCPEKKQPYGTKAKQVVSDLCFGQYVKLIGDGKMDRYKRLIAEIVLPNGININQKLVKNGLAWHFKKYSKDSKYAQLETEARTKKAGLWKEKDPIAPWAWRKARKSAPKKSVPQIIGNKREMVGGFNP